ncbi:MAG: N(G),N(G)-dimethylarginine dimethylaminohydrolase [Candidatus Heimdallarchaeota archaeon]|nr:N(G),N(G)-dimethylarginine dimethylaminohydrolase [Candidatus Heimdallarchaeota archaeon]
MNYRYAITRELGVSYSSCFSDHPLQKYVNVGLAQRQHKVYCETLQSLGIEVVVLPREDRFPDSCFVEDTAVIVGNKAFITRLAIESRRGEEIAISDALKKKFNLKIATEPATIEGGDVVHFENKLICGLSKRTNALGAKQLEDFIGIPVVSFNAQDIMHLKSYVNYLGRNTIIIAERYADHPLLASFQKIIVPRTETYAANSLAINKTVLMPHNYPKSQALVREAGFEVISIDNSEFAKCDGALTCLSLLF